MPRSRPFRTLRWATAIIAVSFMTAAAVLAVSEAQVPPVASKVKVWLLSEFHGRVVQPGDDIPWAVQVRVAGPNRGLALISVDLVQHEANPVFIDLPAGNTAPAGMEALDVPSGFTNPGPGLGFSGYGGTPVLSSLGGSNLLQIGGAQNTFGVAGPCMGTGAAVCIGQSTTVTPGIGRHGEGQMVAGGVFQAPDAAGLYRLVLRGVQASVLGEPASPPLATPVSRISPDLMQGEFWFRVENGGGSGVEVEGVDGSDGSPFDGGMMASGHARDLDAVLRPADGSRLNRTHVRFWWPEVPGAGEYLLEIVQDDGSEDPFALGEVMSHAVAGDEPRTIVTQGLEFSNAYAWRVSGATQVNRFSTIDLPPDMHGFPVVRPNAGDLQPGITLFNLRSNNAPPSISGAIAVAVDENGDFVYFHQRNLGGPGSAGYIQIQPTGRLLMQRDRTAAQGGGGGVFEETIDGRITWALRDDREYSPHHDAQLMPDGDLLLLFHHDMFLPEDNFERRRGDRIVVLDRHTQDELWEWRTVDHYPLESGAESISRWSHGNAAQYYAPHDSIYYSARHFSRVSRIDFSTGDIVYNMGMEWPAGDTDFGDEFFFFQHAPELQPNGNMVVFDNGNTRAPLQTRVVEIAFDDPLFPTDASIVQEDWLVDELGDPLFVSFAGDGDRLDNGNTLVMAGAVRRVQELDPDGRLLWSLSLWRDTESFRGYRAQRLPTVVVDTPGDRDGDWDLDLSDLGGLQAAYGGAGLGFPERLSDFNGDDALDAEDLESLVNWMTGPVE
jgi:hypothetical protein